MASGPYKSFTFLLRQTDKAPAPYRHVVSMKTTVLVIGLVTGLAADLFAGGTLRLKIEPDREVLLAGSPQEVVVKIDLLAVGERKH